MDRELLEKLVAQKLSTRKIAKIIESPQTTLRYWLHKYGLRTETRLNEYRCKCGETDPKKFYGNKKQICKSCHNKWCKIKGKLNRELALKLLGSKCLHCGYDQFSSALDVHHLDSHKKDPNFATMRGWTEKRLLEELKNCVLLCSNCHRAYHNGEIKKIGV